MTKTYRCSAQAVERDTDALLKRSLAFNTLVMLVPMFIMLFTGGLSQPIVLWTFVSFWGLLWAFVVYRTIRRVRKLTRTVAMTYELIVDDLQVARVQEDRPTITIPRISIQKIHERAGQGFRIETADSKLNIWVPRELDGYEEVKTTLLAGTAGRLSTTQYPVALTYSLLVATLVGFLFVLYSHNRMIVTLLGITLLGFYGWYFAYLQRWGVNLAPSTKRSKWVVFLPGVIVIARMIAVWR